MTGIFQRNNYEPLRHSPVVSYQDHVHGSQSRSKNDLSSKFFTFYKTKLRGFSPQANYTDRATADFRRT
jgi:hypothetical protein